MKEKVLKYVDDLFVDVQETRQLKELKEEINSNLLEKINDLRGDGLSDEEAFKEAVSTIGDIDELVDSLKKTSDEDREKTEMTEKPLNRKHVLGYLTGATILLIGIMALTLAYIKSNDAVNLLVVFLPFATISIIIFTYFGLTQETIYKYGMAGKRAFAYSIATGVLILGVFLSLIQYINGVGLARFLMTVLPLVLIPAIIYVYLGLTGEGRGKKGPQDEWVTDQGNTDFDILMGTVSGALWIFAITLFFIVGFSIGWRFSWLLLLFTICIQILTVAFFGKVSRDMGSDELMGTVSGALWIFAIALFFIIGSAIAWKYSWLVFLFTICAQILIVAFFGKASGDMGSEELMGLTSGALWVLAFAVFFIISFTVGWKFSWFVFIVTIAMQLLITGYFMSN